MHLPISLQIGAVSENVMQSLKAKYCTAGLQFTSAFTPLTEEQHPERKAKEASGYESSHSADPALHARGLVNDYERYLKGDFT